MPKPRTTGCAQQHYGPNCSDCVRVRVRRSRARAKLAPRIPLTAAQRLADNAARYVREYLRRGAIAPPDACERCELPTQISPSRPLRLLHPWHPDPAKRRLVAWLCVDCQRIVKATREPLTLTWVWPGLSAPRSRKPANLPWHVTAALAALEEKLPPTIAPAFRSAAFLIALVGSLAPGERERLYGAGALAGPRWQPTDDVQLNVLLRQWVFTERAERSAAARAAGGITVTPLAAVPRRRPQVPLAEPPVLEPRLPIDPEASWAAIRRALERLDEAEAGVAETNARVAQALRDRFV